MEKQAIWIGNDHGGYELKLKIVEYLQKNDYPVVNVGSDSPEIVRYPYYAAKVAGAISRKEAQRGILICSTGIGMSITANKFKGVRAALCYSTYQGKITRAHNDSNILCLGGKCIGVFEALDILEAWLTTEYQGGRHEISLNLIATAEATNFSDAIWTPQIPDQQ
jgi:ribose 5-phosphate isomerase B